MGSRLALLIALAVTVGMGLILARGSTLAAVQLDEDFDGVVAPALPAGWSNVNLIAGACGVPGQPWVTSVTSPDTAPNAAFTNDPNCVDDRALVSPAFQAEADGLVSFRNNYDMESTFDGGVLEISVSGGAFQDIIAAGGTFKSGGYNSTISVNFSSPIGGRQAWSSSSGGYINTSVCLPPSAADQFVRLRWRRTTDNSVSDVGWRVDTIVVQNSAQCAAPTATPTRTAVATATPTPVEFPGRPETASGANVSGPVGAIAAAAAQQAAENRARAAASAPTAVVQAPRTGTGVTPPNTGDAGLASSGGMAWTPLVLALVTVAGFSLAAAAPRRH